MKVKSYLLHQILLPSAMNLLSFISTLILILLWIPNCIYKLLVTFCITKFIPGLRPITNPKSILLSDDNTYENPSNCSILTVLTLKGQLPFSSLMNIFERNVIGAVIKETGKARYPELKQFVINVLGYPFWKEDPYFKLENHIFELHEKSNFNTSTIHERMLNMPFPKLKSPWQLGIYQRTDSNETLLALRFHHCMCDGRSVIKLLVEGLASQKLETTEAKFANSSVFEHLKYILFLPVQLVHINAFQLACRLNFSFHPWKHPTVPLNKSPLFVSFSEKNNLLHVKQFARMAKVQTSAVIIYTISAAIEKYFILNGHSLPKNMPIYLALPKHAHPSHFTNHLHIGFPLIPSSYRMTSPKQRLKIIDEIYKTMREGNHVYHLNCITNMVSSLPKPLRMCMSRAEGVYTGISNIAGEKLGMSVGSYSYSDMSICTGPPQGSIGVTFTILSYRNTFQTAIVANGAILRKSDTNALGKLVDIELKNLGKL